MFRLLIVVFTVVFSNTAFAGDADFANEVKAQSRYYGVGWQRDGQHWSIELLLHKAGGQISYPSLDCSGSWSPNREGAGYVEYIEQISEGLEVCLELGLVRLEPLQNGQVSYEWSESLSAVEARAVLLPVDGKRLSYMEQLKLTLDKIDLSFMHSEFTE